MLADKDLNEESGFTVLKMSHPLFFLLHLVNMIKYYSNLKKRLYSISYILSLILDIILSHVIFIIFNAIYLIVMS